MKVILLVSKDCPPCEEAKQALRPYIERGEVEVRDIEEFKDKLGPVEGAPSVCLFSEAEGRCVNEIVLCDKSKCSIDLARLAGRMVKGWTKEMGS